MEYKKYLRKVGLRLKKRRIALEYTQKDLADILSKSSLSDDENDILSDKQISRLECGENATRIDKLVELSLALGKTPDFFLLGIDRSDDSMDRIIEQISESLKLCSKEEVNSVFSFVQSLVENGKR